MILFYIFISVLVLAAMGVVIWAIKESWLELNTWLKIVLCTLATGQLFCTVMFFIRLFGG